MILLLARALVVVLALSSVSCVSQRDRAVVAATAAGRIADGGHELLAGRYKRSLDACRTLSTRTQAEACTLDVERRYEAAWEGYVVLRAAWLTLAATVAAIDLLGEPVSDVVLLEQLTRLGEAAGEFQRAMRALGEGT